MSVALAPGMQFTMVAGVSRFTFLKIESPITRVFSTGFTAGALLRGRTCEWVAGALVAYVFDNVPKL